MGPHAFSEYTVPSALVLVPRAIGETGCGRSCQQRSLEEMAFETNEVVVG